MPKETCPHCEKTVDLQYGRNVPCPECGGLLYVFDDEHPLEKKSVDSSYTANFLDNLDGNLSKKGTTRTKLHEGQTGGIVGQGVSYEDIGGLTRLRVNYSARLSGR